MSETETEIFNYIKKIRREIHQYPELSGEERNTADIVKRELAALNIKFKDGIAGYGILGVIETGKEGPVIGVRADMDALPIQEKVNVPYKSKIDGKMHACGHDAHTAMLLGTAKYLLSNRTRLNGTILLIFQPSEENAPIGGAKPMLDAGLFESYKPDIILAQHVWPSLPVGQFGVKAGPIMGASDRFEITVKGKGGHASMPHQAVDTIVVLQQLISAFQTIISRNVDPFKNAVITLGKVDAGYRHNAIADRANIEGTVRTMDAYTKGLIKKRMEKVIYHLCQAMDCEYEFNYIDGYPVTQNYKKMSDFAKSAIIKQFGEGSCPEIEPSLAGEDFSRFLEKYKGVYFWLGAGRKDGNARPLHDPAFEIDEEALKYGYEAMVNIIFDYCSAFASSNDLVVSGANKHKTKR
ncbi:M20 metallopeptidase family protein [Virgibacillus halodenitrificans]|uniref:M20 metallopeptidase family protein n=1 Tax=Virgibacillus halodenitrificans TaxID=1482 RepID=UPI0009E771DC|nr:amidohydrolase [Virgibacillus halodenitrificans]